MNGGGNPMEAAECMGFVVGVADTFDCQEDNHGYRWDSSSDVSQPRLVVTVIQHIQSHPSEINGFAHLAVGAALQDSFPCTSVTGSN